VVIGELITRNLNPVIKNIVQLCDFGANEILRDATKLAVLGPVKNARRKFWPHAEGLMV
jgi:hypothetical protein